MARLAFYTLLILTMLVVPVSAPYLGTTEGYVRDWAGNLISGASVSVVVQNCSESCTGSAVSDVGGYYVVANLNLPVGGNVSVSAQKGAALGSSAGIADSFFAAFVNVTIAEPPSAPILVDVLDSHNRTVVFEWSSGIDPNNLPTYDVFVLDGSEAGISPPYTTNVSFGFHTWAVQTCNAYSCSTPSIDSFTVFNNPPSIPILTVQPHTQSASVILSWKSGIDPDGDPTYDQYRFDGNVKNATSPQIESLADIAYYEWGVRTCDVYGACSAWNESNFIKYPACPVSPTCPVCRPPGAVCPACLPPNITVCQEEWVCEEWGPCIEPGLQSRECVDVNECGTVCHKPDTVRKCVLPIEVVPGVELPWLIVIAIFVMALSALLVYIVVREGA